MGSRARLAGAAARIAYAIIAAYATLAALEIVGERIAAIYPPAAPAVQRGAVVLALLAAASTRLVALPLLAIIVLAVLDPAPVWPILLVGLGMVHWASTLYAKGYSGARVVSRRRLLAGLGIAALAILAPGLAFTPAPLYLDRLMAAVDEVAARAGGELPTVERLLSQTLLYRVIVAGLVLGVAYKILYQTVELILAALLPQAYARAEAEATRRSEARVLVEFRGPQYPVLESAAAWLLAFLFAPIVYDSIGRGLSALPVQVDPVYRALASTAISLAAGWAVLRIIALALTRSLNMDALARPRLGVPLVLGLLVSAGITMVYLVAGGNPLELLAEAATGRPGARDPFADLVNAAPGEDYYRSLAKLVDLLVRLFWGG